MSTVNFFPTGHFEPETHLCPKQPLSGRWKRRTKRNVFWALCPVGIRAHSLFAFNRAAPLRVCLALIFIWLKSPWAWPIMRTRKSQTGRKRRAVNLRCFINSKARGLMPQHRPNRIYAFGWLVQVQRGRSSVKKVNMLFVGDGTKEPNHLALWRNFTVFMSVRAAKQTMMS